MQNNFQDIKLYFIDLDGTALDSLENFHHFPSLKNINAIKKARKMGKEVIISTGRSGQNLVDIAKAIGGKYFIQANGALITNHKGQEVFVSRISIRQNILLAKIIRKYKLAFKFDDQYQIYGAKKRLAKTIANKAGWKINKSYAYPMHQEYLKIVCFGLLSRKKINKIAHEIVTTIPGLNAVTSAKGFSIEITGAKATKGHAALLVSKLLKVPRNLTAHVGDSMNDATAIGKVGHFIAMKNAVKDLRKKADFIGPHYKKAGLSKILDGKFKKIN